MEMTVK